MENLLDLLLFAARVILVMACFRNLMLLVTGTTRNYAEWSAGVGGFLYLAGVVFDYANWEHIVPGRDVSRVMCAVGVALVVLPSLLHWVAPRVYTRLNLDKEC